MKAQSLIAGVLSLGVSLSVTAVALANAPVDAVQTDSHSYSSTQATTGYPDGTTATQKNTDWQHKSTTDANNAGDPYTNTPATQVHSSTTTTGSKSTTHTDGSW